jgi:general secretion pathway protein G
MTRPNPPRRRPGFTLVELMIVIVIIGILVALLVPAIAGVVRRANNGRVTAEINTMAQALEKFKSTYGDYPPSRIILSESGSYPLTSTLALSDTTIVWFGQGPKSIGTPDITLGQLAERSVRYLRKFFTKAAPPNTGGTPPTWHDFNGNGALDAGFLYLEGHECLAFFLGGIPTNDGQTIAMSGFGRDPVRPFTTQALVVYGTSNAVPPQMRSDARTAPYLEFSADRLIDDDGDGIPGYVDTLHTGNDARFYAYFFAYGNNVYDPNDVNSLEDYEENPGSLAQRRYLVNVGLAGGGVTTSTAPNPYTTNNPTSASTRANFVNPTSYQIISAGGDSRYGPGGQFVASGTGERLPADADATARQRQPERDNLSNFTQGTLE